MDRDASSDPGSGPRRTPGADTPHGAPTPEGPTPAPRESAPRPLARARRLAWLLDESIPVPGTSWRVGLDPLVGLVPGLGDWVSWGVGLHLLWGAGRMGAGPGVLLRMAGNLVVDAVTGVVPVLGDLFDLAWKANTRNLRLLEAHAADATRTERTSRWIVGSILGGSVAALVAGAWGAIWVLRTVLQWIF